jgi:hypothetical protein
MGIALIVGLLYYLLRRLNFPFRDCRFPKITFFWFCSFSLLLWEI